MSSLWSRTKSAINSGYGMNFHPIIGLPNPFYKARPLGGSSLEDIPERPVNHRLVENKNLALNHPGINAKIKKILEEYKRTHPSEFVVKNYHNRLPSNIGSGGKSLIKGSKEAKARMAYLRSLRSKKLKGRGKTRSYNNAALYGGNETSEFFSTLLQSLGASAMSTIKNLALETGASLTQLLADPKALVQKLSTFAPGVAKKVKKFFGIQSPDDDIDDDENPELKRKKQYLEMLKLYDPELYEAKKKEAMKRKIEKMQKDLEEQQKKMNDSSSSSSSSSSSNNNYNKGRLIFY